MFVSRPPRVALACVGLWLAQLLLTVVVYRLEWVKDHEVLDLWWAALLATSLLLGVVLVTQLPRALRWRPRRSPRVHPALLAERQRIARDLHDRVGSQLLNAVALLDARAPQPHAAREVLALSLLDLRLIVDAMAADGDPLPHRLARLRHRLQPVLDQRGIRMVWDVPDGAPDGALHGTEDGGLVDGLPGVLPPAGRVAAEITAIAQEALSNVLQHAQQANEVHVSLQYLAHTGCWCLRVQDNGQGVATARGDGPAGQGLRSMAQRAHALGGSLRAETPPGGGLLLRLEIPAHAESLL